MIKDKLVEGYGFIGTDPNTLYKFGNGKYKTFEGTEIVAENCVKAKVKDLVVEGKTIQDTEDLSNIESVAEKEGNVLSAKINDNTTTLNLPIPLRSLPNGTCDTIEGNKLIQRVEKIVLTKREDITEWGKTSDSYGHKLYYISSKIYGKIGKCNNAEVGVTSNKFRGICDDSWRTSNEVNSCFINVNGVLHFLVDETQFPDIESFNDWLGNNKVIVYYPLATPIIHNLEIPSISTTKGTNVITTTNNIKPNLKIKVKVK